MLKANYFINGEFCALRELRETDLLSSWPHWFNDSEITRFQNKGIFPNSIEKQRAYYDHLKNSSTDIVLAILSKETEKHIGNVGLHKIDWVHRSAELGIVLGDKESWGKGIGKEAWSLITRYAFETLNLHRVYATIMAGNNASIKCAEASGFKKEGLIRDMFYKNGVYLDGHFMNCLKSDFRK